MMNLRQARADRALIQSAIGYQFDICVMELTETRRYTNVGLYAQDGEHRFYSVSAASPTRWSQGTVVVIEMTGEPARTALQGFHYTVATTEWHGPVRPRRSEKTKDIQITSH